MTKIEYKYNSWGYRCKEFNDLNIHDNIVIQIESLTKINHNYDLIILDESESVFKLNLLSKCEINRPNQITGCGIRLFNLSG